MLGPGASFLRPHTICCRWLPLAQPYRLLIRLRTINSLVNEQANDGLQHIKRQLAYMSADNFICPQISSVAKIGKYRQLLKLANIVSCQNWRISSVAKIGKHCQLPKLMFVAKFGKFCGHQSCRNWSLNIAKEDVQIWQILDIIPKLASNGIF